MQKGAAGVDGLTVFKFKAWEAGIAQVNHTMIEIDGITQRVAALVADASAPAALQPQPAPLDHATI